MLLLFFLQKDKKLRTCVFDFFVILSIGFLVLCVCVFLQNLQSLNLSFFLLFFLFFLTYIVFVVVVIVVVIIILVSCSA